MTKREIGEESEPEKKEKIENPARGLEPERIMGAINSSAEFTFLILE